MQEIAGQRNAKDPENAAENGVFELASLKPIGLRGRSWNCLFYKFLWQGKSQLLAESNDCLAHFGRLHMTTNPEFQRVSVAAQSSPSSTSNEGRPPPLKISHSSTRCGSIHDVVEVRPCCSPSGPNGIQAQNCSENTASRVGGCGAGGVRRGRRDPENLRAGDALDFWRVELDEPPHRLHLCAEMKLPGRAWLEFAVTGDAQRSNISANGDFRSGGFVRLAILVRNLSPPPVRFRRNAAYRGGCGAVPVPANNGQVGGTVMPAGSRNPRCSIPSGLQRKTSASFARESLL